MVMGQQGIAGTLPAIAMSYQKDQTCQTGKSKQRCLRPSRNLWQCHLAPSAKGAVC